MQETRRAAARLRLWRRRDPGRRRTPVRPHRGTRRAGLRAPRPRRRGRGAGGHPPGRFRADAHGRGEGGERPAGVPVPRPRRGGTLAALRHRTPAGAAGGRLAQPDRPRLRPAPRPVRRRLGHAQVADAPHGGFSLDLGIEIDGVRHPLLPILLPPARTRRHGRGAHRRRRAGHQPGRRPHPETAGRAHRPPAGGDGRPDRGGPPQHRRRAGAGRRRSARRARPGGPGHHPLAGRRRDRRPCRALPRPGRDPRRGAAGRLHRHAAPLPAAGRELAAASAARTVSAGFSPTTWGSARRRRPSRISSSRKPAGRLDRPALVVVPTSLVPNWTAELARFAPHLRVVVLHGLDRHERRRRARPACMW